MKEIQTRVIKGGLSWFPKIYQAPLLLCMYALLRYEKSGRNRRIYRVANLGVYIWFYHLKRNSYTSYSLNCDGRRIGGGNIEYWIEMTWNTNEWVKTGYFRINARKHGATTDISRNIEIIRP